MRNFTKTLISLSFLLILLSLFLTVRVYGQGGCIPLYGGGVSCPKSGEIFIDKQIKHPTKDILVDNLTFFDPKFAPEQLITFRIVVKNTGEQSFDRIEVKDIMPDYLSFISGEGTFNQNEGKNGVLTFNIANLKPGESREYWLTSKVFKAGDIPKDLICQLQNRVQARSSDDKFNEDTAQYCVEKVSGVIKGAETITEIPKTGSPYFLTLLTLLTFFKLGLMLKKKSEMFKVNH